MEVRESAPPDQMAGANDWRTDALGALVVADRPVSYGIVQTGPTVFQGVPCLRVVDIRDGQIHSNDLILTSPEISKAYSRTVLRRGDLVMPLRGKVGEVAMAGAEHAGFNLTRGVAIIAPRAEVHGPYLKYFLSAPMTRVRLEQSMNGSALQEISIATLRSFCVDVPKSYFEQQAIAEALSDADALIESLSLLLAKKRHIKQGAMQELLTGKKRLPGFSGEWIPRPLDQLADIRSGGTPSTAQDQFWNGDVLWCTPTDITALNGHKYLTGTARRLTLLGMHASSAEWIPPRSVVMTSRATIGECAINTVAVTTNQGFKNFVPLENVDAEFLYYLLQTQRAGFISLCSGSTFLEIGKAQLSAFEVVVPVEKNEQVAISRVLSQMDESIATLEGKLAKAKHLKQGMMQALLTGRIRLVQPA